LWISVPVPLVGEEFEQDRVAHLGVDDDDALHALFEARRCGLDFGIMPPEMVPSAISLRASLMERSGMSFFDCPEPPGTSVSSNSRLAFRAPATAPAKVSALTLKVCPGS